MTIGGSKNESIERKLIVNNFDDRFKYFSYVRI